MARPPNTGQEYPDEIVTDREIQPLTVAGGKIPTIFIVIAAAAGLLTLALLQFLGGGDDDAEVAAKPVVTIPAAVPEELPTPRPVLPAPTPPVIEDDEEDDFEPVTNLNVVELERRRRLALLEQQRAELESERLRALEDERVKRLKSDILIVDRGGSSADAGGRDTFSETVSQDPFDYGDSDVEDDPNNRNELITSRENRFLRDAANEKVVKARAVKLANQDFLLTQGTFITGITETAINSDLPGMIRAVVDKPVYSRTGKYVLVPRGSRLIGRYQSGLATGQKRVFVVWSRLERPDGVVISLGSPGADALGRAGMAGDVDNHFFERFGTAALLSALGPALAAVFESDNQSATQREIIRDGSNDFQRQSEIALRDQLNIKPTITVPQGSEIVIFVNRDLSFDSIEG